MRRRQFIAGFGSAVAMPPVARAQNPATPLLGFLSSLSQSQSEHLVAAFRRGLSDNGYLEGQTVAIDYRWADGAYERLPEMARDLVARNVTVLVSTGGNPTLRAAQAATSTVPIVFSTGIDPLQAGFIASFSRPGRNMTGVYVVTIGLEAKRFGLLQELVPGSATTGVLINPRNPNSDAQANDVQAAARTVARPIQVFHASSDHELEAAFAAIGQVKPAALMVAADPWLSTRRQRLIEFAERRAIPTMYQWREFTEAGGLMSYGTNLADAYRQVGVYVTRILKGADPAELPVLQPTRFELVINLRTAKSLNLQIPPGVLAIADEVIE